MFKQKERAHAKSQCENTENQKEYIQRRSLCQLVYKKLENIRNISNEQYETVIKEYPILGIMFSHKAEELETWISEAKAHDIQEIQSFLEGTCKDIDAVKN